MPVNNALFIVATPIGNLSDITFRAVEILNSVDVVAAEDTRHSAKLFNHFNISTPLRAYHDHSDDEQVAWFIESLLSGKSVALISDAGTPLISDPGYRLVRKAREAGIQVVPVPGASAFVAGLCASGLASDSFRFEGFPPAKPGARLSFFERFVGTQSTLIFYESPHRILDSLNAMLHVFGETRDVAVARELTKTYETFLTGNLHDVIDAMQRDSNQQRGEFVVMVAGAEPVKDVISDEARKLMTLLVRELPKKRAAALTAEYTGVKKNALYQWALDNDL